MEHITNELFKLGYHLSYIDEERYYFKSNRYTSCDYVVLILDLKNKKYHKARYFITASYAHTFDEVPMTKNETRTIEELMKEEN